MKIFLLLLLITTNSSAWFFFGPHKPFFIVLQTASDSSNPGRIIDDAYESNLAYLLVTEIKNRINQNNNRFKIQILKKQIMNDQFETISYINRLTHDLLLMISLYHHEKDHPEIKIYQYKNNKTFIAKETDLAFYDWDTIYLLSSQKTTKHAQNLLQAMAYSNQIESHFYQLPVAPLLGIKSPALFLEIGIKNKEDLPLLIDSLIYGISQLYV